MDLLLCPRHLHDSWAIDGLGPAVTAVRATTARRQVAALAAAAKTITGKSHRWSPSRNSAASQAPGGMSPAAAYEGAVSELVNDTYGEVYLGVAETEVWSPGQSSGLDAQAPRRH
jgi:hypothetical protein